MKIEILADNLKRAEEALEEAFKGLKEARKLLIQELEKNENWNKFQFSSPYYGSHPEYGERDKNETYYFRKGVDFLRFVGQEFAHGHYSQHDENEEFEEFLGSLVEGVDYFVFET
jgi:hypothetical protein